ncbi:MAG: BRO-N domain-containing protein [Patescibacteria group bacterium]
MKNPKKQVTLFEEKEVRRTWYDEQWYFVIIDVVLILTDSLQPDGYLKDMRRRDEELSKGWGQIATPLSISTKGGVQKLNCANLQGIFRIIQSIPSPKAEPFKQWLAKVGQERIEEIQDPELAIVRAKKIYEKKGYSDDWIAKRMRGINIRNTLTDQWKNRGAQGKFDFAILTNEIYRGTFEMDAKEIKKFKSLDNPDNPRDHMNELELILTMLGETTTTEITDVRNSKGLPELAQDAKEGGQVAGNTRKEIEQKTGKKIMTKKNFLNNQKK